jgi:multidrug efflux pump subunit AcrA (membrane-fusion protein)
MEDIMLKKFLPIILILALAFAGVSYAVNELMPGSEGEEVKKIVYSTDPVIKGDINVGVNTSGQLNASYGGGIKVPEATSPEFYGISYIIEEFLVEEGDSMKAEEPVIRLSSNDLETRIDDLKSNLENKKDYLAQLLGIDVRDVENVNPYDGIVIISPIEGRVTELQASEGEELDGLIANIINDSEIKISFKVLESEYSLLYEGQSILLKFPYFEGYYEGKISDLNPNSVPNDDQEFGMTYVHWGEITASNPGLVQTNMTASISTPVSGAVNLPKETLSESGKVVGYGKEKKIFKSAISSDEITVTEVLVNEMDYVEKGQAIVKLAGADVRLMIQEKLDEINEIKRTIAKAQEMKGSMLVLSPMDGVVSGFWRTQGETVSPGDWIGDIFNTNNMRVWTQVDDIDVVYIKQDAPVKVTIDALPGEEFEGVVTRVSQSGKDSSGIIKYSVDIEVSGSGELRPGMMAQCFIDAGESLDTLLVPIEAVFEEDGVTKVEILKDDESVEIMTIETGLMNDRYVEIISGLEEGNLVITGSSSDLLPSEHIKDNNTFIPENNN